MPRRNPTKRQTTLMWTSDDEPYNDAAMGTFIDLFREQHDEAEPHISLFVDEMEAIFNSHPDDKSDLIQVINELVRRRIARKMKR